MQADESSRTARDIDFIHQRGFEAAKSVDGRNAENESFDFYGVDAKWNFDVVNN